MGCYEQNSISKYEIISKQKVGFTLFYTEIKRSFNNLEIFLVLPKPLVFYKNSMLFNNFLYPNRAHNIFSLGNQQRSP